MKKFVKITGILLLLVIIVLIALPFVFKGKIEQSIKEIANDNVNAKVEFTGADISLISSFPSIALNINDFSIEGQEVFEGVKLVDVKRIYTTIGFWSLFGDKIEVKSVTIEEPKIDVRVLEDGTANYDIAKESEEESSTESDSSPINIDLQHYAITNAVIKYTDSTMPFVMNLNNLNHEGDGDFSAEQMQLNTNTTIDEMTVEFDNIKYMNQVKFSWEAILDMDLKNAKYTFQENVLKLNELMVKIDGWVSMPADDINMDITYSTTKSDFKQLLSMIPAEFATDLNGVDVDGELIFDGFVKGVSNDKMTPGFGLNLGVEDGRFQYPDLPKAVENIQIDVHVLTQGGSNLNDLVIDVSKCYMELATNPVDIKFNIKNAMTDPLIDCKIRAKLMLDNLKDVIPLEKGDALEGTMNADVAMKGRLSALENEEYDNFNASGNMIVQDILYKTDSLPYDVNIHVAYLDFSSEYMNLSQFKANIGKSDIQAFGKASNYIAYALKNEKIKGDFTITSKLMDLNEMMAEDEDVSETEGEDVQELSVIDIPGNIDFNLRASFDEMKYGDMIMNNVTGLVRIDDHVASLKNMEMDFMEGHLKMNGDYDSRELTAPKVDIDLDMKNMSIQKMANEFYTIDKMAPLAKSCQGNFSAKMDFEAVLNQAMEPKEETIKGVGNMQVKEVYVEKFEPLNKLAETLKIDRLKKQSFKNVNLSYTIEDGKAIVKPFNIKIDGMDCEVEGTTGLVDQAINYTMKMDMPYGKLPKQATGALDGLMGQINNQLGSNISTSTTIPLNIKITGTTTNPKIRADYGELVQNTIQDVKEDIKEEVKEQVDRAKEEARKRAQKEADDILRKGRSQADKYLADAQKLADKGKDESYKQAAKVEASYGNFLEKKAKEIAADKLRDTANKVHKAAMDRARKEADNILKKAKKQADAKIASAR